MVSILNIETSTTVCSVSVAVDGDIVATKEQNTGYTHAENLTTFIDDVLCDANLKLSKMDAIAISSGPGSYTGLRIGVSTAKGLCYALNKPLIAVDTLRYLANMVVQQNVDKFDEMTLFCPMIDARRMEVYCGLYNLDNEEVQPISALIIDDNSFANILERHNVIFFGNGANKCRSVFDNVDNATVMDGMELSAKGMGEPSYNMYLNKNFMDVAYYEPFYLKDFVAKKARL